MNIERWMRVLWERKVNCYVICAVFILIAVWRLVSISFAITQNDIFGLVLCAAVAVYAIYKAGQAER